MVVSRRISKHNLYWNTIPPSSPNNAFRSLRHLVCHPRFTPIFRPDWLNTDFRSLAALSMPKTCKSMLKQKASIALSRSNTVRKACCSSIAMRAMKRSIEKHLVQRTSWSLEPCRVAERRWSSYTTQLEIVDGYFVELSWAFCTWFLPDEVYLYIYIFLPIPYFERRIVVIRHSTDMSVDNFNN